MPGTRDKTEIMNAFRIPSLVLNDSSVFALSMDFSDFSVNCLTYFIKLDNLTVCLINIRTTSDCFYVVSQCCQIKTDDVNRSYVYNMVEKYDSYCPVDIFTILWNNWIYIPVYT